jgi:hypothetical protein
VGEGLSASQPSVGRADRAGRGKHGAVSVKHHEGSVLVGQPAESLKGDEAVAPDYHQPAQPVAHARQADGPALICYAVMREQVARVYLDTDAIAAQNQNARFADGVRVR